MKNITFNVKLFYCETCHSDSRIGIYAIVWQMTIIKNLHTLISSVEKLTALVKSQYRLYCVSELDDREEENY